MALLYLAHWQQMQERQRLWLVSYFSHGMPTTICVPNLALFGTPKGVHKGTFVHLVVLPNRLFRYLSFPMCWEPTGISICPQGDDGINPRSPSRRKIARQQRHSTKQDHHRRKCLRIIRSGAEQKRRYEPCNYQRAASQRQYR